MSRSRGSAYGRLRSRASKKRKRLIAENGFHAEDILPQSQYDEEALRASMSPKHRKLLREIESKPKGRKALRQYRKFWGLPFPLQIREIEMPGPASKTEFLVGMGRTPEVHLSEGPKGRGGRRVRKRGDWLPASNADGDRIYLLTGRSSNAQDSALREVGFAPETHYIPTDGMEDAGTFKAGKHWVHKHDDDGGDWPKVFQDAAGNFVYDKSTYRINEWIER